LGLLESFSGVLLLGLKKFPAVKKKVAAVAPAMVLRCFRARGQHCGFKGCSDNSLGTASFQLISLKISYVYHFKSSKYVVTQMADPRNLHSLLSPLLAALPNLSFWGNICTLPPQKHLGGCQNIPTWSRLVILRQGWGKEKREKKKSVP